ncbi:MAG TPA: SdrD B-like domain-containing protein, partial [Tepidisphaeraceae bacterium]|nr:SdrD B-like domain-containing protein [Tepidisphaeraceae bacterium]
GSISGKAFKDADKDGVYDSGEAGLGGATLFLDKDKDGVKDLGEPTATADSLGNYKFSNLAAGSYRVREVAPAGQKVTAPASGYYDLTVGSGQNLTGKNFANQPTATATVGTVSGKVFNDADGDGILDAGETGRSGVTLWIDKDKDGVKDAGEQSATTDSSGNYKFSNVPAGGVRVRMTGVSGHRITTPASGYHDFSLGGGGSATGKNFGVSQRVLISGRVWVDSDKDGVKDAAEQALGGWRVYIDRDKDGVFDSGEPSVTTDASGNYSFKSLVAGSFRVRIGAPGGYTRIAPSSGYYDLTLGNGGVARDRNFRYA